MTDKQPLQNTQQLDRAEEMCEQYDHQRDDSCCTSCGSDEGTEESREEWGWVVVCVSCGCEVYRGRK